MKRFTGCLVFFLCGVSLSAQDFKEIDGLLDRDKAFQSLFYLNQKRSDKRYTQPLFRFKVNNRLIESHQINRSPTDSVRRLIGANELILSQIHDEGERQYFQFLKLVSGSADHRAESVRIMTQTPFIANRVQGAAFMKLGDWLQDERKYDQSIRWLEKALEVFRKDSSAFYLRIQRVYYLSGISYRNLALYGRSVACYQAALRILSVIPEPMNVERARLLNSLANVYSEANDYAGARKNYLESLRIKEMLHDSAAIATTRNNLATFYERSGNFSEARNCYSRALLFSPKPKTKKDQTILNMMVSNYCVLLREVGEFSISDFEARKALMMSQPTLAPDELSVVRLRLRLAEDAISAKDYTAATIEMEKIAGLMSGYAKDDPAWNEYEPTLTNFLFVSEKYDSCYHVCLNLLQRLKGRNSTPENLYYTYLKTGNAIEKTVSTREAMPYYVAGNKVAVASGHTPIILGGLHTIAEAFQAQGELDSAEAYTEKMMSLNYVQDTSFRTSSTDFIDVDLAIAAFVRKAQISFDRYQQQKADKLLNEACDQMGLALRWIRRKRESLSSENDKFQFGAKVQEAFQTAVDIYYEQYRKSGSDEHFELLLQVAELSRAQSLLANLKFQAVERFAGITRAINNRESQLFQREKDLLFDLERFVANRENYSPEIYREHLSEFRKLGETKKQFLDSIRQNLPTYYQLKYDQTLVTGKDLAGVLTSGRLLVEYVSGRGQTYAIGMAGHGRFVVAVASSLLIGRSVSLLRNQLFFKQPEELIKTAQALYRQTFAPVDSAIKIQKWKIKEVVVIPDGGLTLLPFELLVTSISKKPHFLVEEYSMYYNYSATLFWQKSTDPVVSRGKGMAGFAPVFSSVKENKEGKLREDVENFQFTELVETKAEVDFIARIFEKQKLGKSQVYDATASESTFKKIQFDQLSVLHLATHGFAGLNGPHRSGIVFGRGGNGREDNILFAEEVYSMHMPVDLVTLSACETGLGKYYSGEGLVGLTRAFFYAGVRSLLVSMWKVQDASTAALMKDFYQSYFSGSLSKAEALRAAKLKMIRSKEYHDPFYWSPFVLAGANP